MEEQEARLGKTTTMLPEVVIVEMSVEMIVNEERATEEKTAGEANCRRGFAARI